MNIARFDLVTLELFVAVARCGSITGGANQCHLAVAAASKRISDLEAHLGASLLYRHASGVKLTEAGHVCFQHALGVLEGVQRMSGAMSDYAAGVRGQIRIWANTSAITQFLPDDLSAFMRQHPGIRIGLEERNSVEVVAALRENRADIGIFAERTRADDVAVFEYRRDQLVMVTTRDHPLAQRKSISLSDAVDYDFVSLADATSLAERLHAESIRLDKPLKLRIQVRSFDALCGMVKAGLGIGVLPQLSAQPHVRSMGLKMIRLEDAWAKRTLLLALRDIRALPLPVRLLASALSAEAAQTLASANA
ncbi:transcriptional regulator, LysR family [Noviherbaspirillum humi]|uniref:Transcriptional regulator, LysR family n=1 Tax=Noviherbaspirillum humi TaxID=1688639 RepID=A0A239HRQ7_9BURK|nr:LysR family transcriptional regulator [Noviherbaspirillum humi]SNS84067.1 transcriptional regulator, LysR family [Noviherbaspirillum humi]